GISKALHAVDLVRAEHPVLAAMAEDHQAASAVRRPPGNLEKIVEADAEVKLATDVDQTLERGVRAVGDRVDGTHRSDFLDERGGEREPLRAEPEERDRARRLDR